jgi:hypothetical protein
MSCSYRGIIKVNVGKGAKRDSFDVHNALLTARSLFFKSALNGNWVEAIERAVNLPEDDPQTFKTYVHLLYTGDFATESDPNLGIDESHDKLLSLAKLYVLAEKLQDIETKNESLTVLITTAKKLNVLLPSIAVQYIRWHASDIFG